MNRLLGLPPVTLASTLCALVSALLFAVTFMPGFLPIFGISVLVAILAMRQAMIMPGSLFICFFTLLLLVAPYFDLRLDVLTARVTELYTYWPENHLLLAVVGLILLMLIVHLVTLNQWKVRCLHLALRRISPIQLLGILGLGIASEVILFAVGAGRHTAGFNEIPFVGVLNTIKTLPELLVVVSAFCVVRASNKRLYTFIIVVTLIENLATSMMSGRKEDLLMASLMTMIGFWSSVKTPSKFVVQTVIPSAIVMFVFLPFMYHMRAHPAFNRMDATSTPLDIINDTIEGKYEVNTNSGGFLQRLDLLEPTARYFGKQSAPMYDQNEVWMMFACSVIPRFLWPDKPYEQPQMGYRFAVAYGYASDEGITSIAFGYLVEMHFLFGWVGVALLALLPWAFNSGPLLSLLLLGRVWPAFYLWVLYKFAIFVERTIVVGIIEVLPYALLALGLEAVSSVYRSFILVRLKPDHALRTVDVAVEAPLSETS